MAYPPAFEGMVEAFARFPGIGRRTAERLAFHVLRDPDSRRLSDAIQRAVQETLRCGICCNLADSDPCAICSDAKRAPGQILVVEEPRDVEAVERAGIWNGRYHVLMGSWNPAEGTEPRHLTVGQLVGRAGAAEVEEVVLATDPDSEGEATALLVLEAIEEADLEVRVTRLARGLPAGSALEYLHRGVLEDALDGRRSMRR